MKLVFDISKIPVLIFVHIQYVKRPVLSHKTVRAEYS